MAGLDRSVTLTVKVTPADAKAIKRAAAAAEMTVSDYVRATTLVTMALDGDRHAVRMLVRGALRVSGDVWERIRHVIPGIAPQE